MSSKELKSVIHHVVDELPENVLEEAYTFLQNLQQETTTPQVHQAQVKKILTEDHELLQKLAE